MSLSDITSVIAGGGLEGGATSGAATVNVGAGSGITVNTDDVAVTAAQTTITSVYNTSLSLGRDVSNSFNFGTLGAIKAIIAGVEQVHFKDGSIIPRLTNDIDLGTASLEFKDAWFDGTVTSDAFSGPLTGNADTATTAGTVTADAQPAIESIGTDGDTLSILSDQLVMSNATADMPTIKLTNTTDDSGQSEIIFEKLRDDDGVASGQNLGAIWFRGQDAGQNTEDYAYIIGEIDVSTSGQESGQLVLGVANHDGGNGSGLILTGGSEDNEIDVTVGLGANSVVTIPGDIDLAGDIDVDGTLETDALTVDGVAFTPSTTKQLESYNYRADQDTTKTYISMADGDSEATVTTAAKLPITAPFAGKLLKVFLKSNKNLSSHTLTWRLETQATGVTFSTGPTIVGTQSGAGCTNSSITNYDFTSSLDSGDNIIDAGDTVFISLQSDTDFGSNVIYYVTCLWEWDLS